MDKLWTKDNKTMRRIIRAAAAGGIAVSLAGCSLLPKEEEALAPPLVKPVKENFEIYEVKRGNMVKQVTGVGTFASSKIQYLYFNESGGRLLSMDTQLGATVKRGDILARLDRADSETKVRQQEIVLEKAKLALEQTKEEKRGDVNAMKTKLLDVQKETITLEMLTNQLNRTRLVSDVDGVVTFVDPIKQGDVVQAYKSLVTIADPRELKLTYEFSNLSDMTGIQVGMEADLMINKKPYKGTVVQIPATAPVSDNKAVNDKNSKTIVIVPTNPPEVKIGSNADINIVTEKRDNVIIIPRVGLRSYLGRDYVQVLEGESRKEIDVEKGIVSATEVEIRKGLKEGQKVILNN
jgi:RND family efflux transporter MFP subunit